MQRKKEINERWRKRMLEFGLCISELYGQIHAAFFCEFCIVSSILQGARNRRTYVPQKLKNHRRCIYSMVSTVLECPGISAMSWNVLDFLVFLEIVLNSQGLK